MFSIGNFPRLEFDREELSSPNSRVSRRSTPSPALVLVRRLARSPFPTLLIPLNFGVRPCRIAPRMAGCRSSLSPC